MKKYVLKQLRAIRRMAETSGIEVAGQLRIDVRGTIDEWDNLLSDLKSEGWTVYRHYVNIGNVTVAILLF